MTTRGVLTKPDSMASFRPSPHDPRKTASSIALFPGGAERVAVKSRQRKTPHVRCILSEPPTHIVASFYIFLFQSLCLAFGGPAKRGGLRRSGQVCFFPIPFCCPTPPGHRRGHFLRRVCHNGLAFFIICSSVSQARVCQFSMMIWPCRSKGINLDGNNVVGL